MKSLFISLNISFHELIVTNNRQQYSVFYFINAPMLAHDRKRLNNPRIYRKLGLNTARYGAHKRNNHLFCNQHNRLFQNTTTESYQIYVRQCFILMKLLKTKTILMLPRRQKHIYLYDVPLVCASTVPTQGLGAVGFVTCC